MKNHQISIKELVQRDKNHPSVVAWSIANEPRSQQANCEPYWRNVSEFAKAQDASRPITASLNRESHEDKLVRYSWQNKQNQYAMVCFQAQFLDIVSFNRYNSWYRNEGRLDMIVNMLLKEARAWREKFNKPVLMSEYGADTMEGLHIVRQLFFSSTFECLYH